MAKIAWAPGIEYVSGAMTKINTKSFHKLDQNMFLATHRVAATTSDACSRSYFRKVYNLPWQGTSIITADVSAIRARFTAVSRAVAARKQDLSQITTDQAAFEAQKNQPGGKKTMTAYLWSLEGAIYDQAHPRS